MKKWWKARSRQEKWMVAIIAMLLIGIVIRWEFVSKEAGDSFRWRFSSERQEQLKTDRPEYVEGTDNTGQDSVENEE